MSKQAARLYKQYQPGSYKLDLSINKDKLSFEGSVIISGKKVGRPSQRITFHQKGLKVSSASIIRHQNTGEQEILVDRIVTHKSYDELRLHAKDMLPAGSYTITINFSGKISESMLGIYPSRFTHNKKEHVIIATQFESHHAREAFPCIDEPEAKAEFDLSITADKTDVVIFNMPMSQETDGETNKTTVFETTPKMSTYLLAFVLGELHSVEATTKHGVLVRSWSSIARPKKELQYSVDEAVKVLEFFNDYFGVDYPLKKCDQVALPDFDAGAMENWGLVTYREVALLTDPDNRSISSEQYVSMVIAHELSHQWFGNLVTMKWWDDLWLNESFASIMEHLALDTIHPQWQQWEAYAATDIISTTSRDIYKDIQPVGVKVTDPDLIHTLFDPSIVYAKGGRLLKMLMDYIGDETFKAGLLRYFKKHAYGNTTRDDLWQALSEASSKNISALMTPWIEQSGMPIVKVSQSGKAVELSQKRYVLDSKNDKRLWPIPLLASHKLSSDILTTQKTKLTAASDGFVMLNQFGSGHFFTQYTQPDHQKYIIDQVKLKTIPAQSRINILNDSLMLARIGETSLVEALKLAISCDNEDRDSVWSLISRIIGTAQTLTEGDEATEKNIKLIKRSLAAEEHKKLGWEDHKNDDPNTKQIRHTMLAMMISAEDSATIKKAKQLYSEAASLESINSEIRSTILVSNVRHGNKAVAQALIKAYPEVASDIQSDIALALSSTKDPLLAQDILTRAIGKNGFVRPQDLTRWLAYFLRNRHIRQVAWDHMLKQWAWLEKTLSDSKSYDYIPVYCASVATNEAWQKQYQQLFEPLLSDKTLLRNITIGLADIQARLDWRKRDELSVAQFIAGRAKILSP